MAKNNKSVLIAITLIIIGLFLSFSKDLGLQSILLPELDNRITYFDKEGSMSQFVKILTADGSKVYENDKFICNIDDERNLGNIASAQTSELKVMSPSPLGGGASCSPKQDFSRLKTYIKAQQVGSVSNIFLNGNELQVPQANLWGYFEIIPDNLNIGV